MKVRLLLAAGLLSLSSLALSRPQPLQAQSLVGQCRQANRRIEIFSEPSVGPTSRFIRSLQPGERVELAGEPNNGWVPVRQPAVGFAIARYLTDCNTAIVPPPPMPSTVCRRAAFDLAIRPRPVAGSEPAVGSVRAGQAMAITQQTQRDSEGRIWYEIVEPARGWVSSGRSSGVNLTQC